MVRVPEPERKALLPVTLKEPVTVRLPVPPSVPPSRFSRLTNSPAPLAMKLPPSMDRVPAMVDDVAASPSVNAPPAPMVSDEPATVFRPLMTMPGPESVTFAVPTLM